MKAITLIFTSLYLALSLSAQSDYRIFLDKGYSSITSSENLLSLHRIVSNFENENLKPKLWEEKKWGGKTLGIGYRLTKTILLDYQFDYLMTLHQHEVFGHGYRYREFEYEGNSYNMNLLPPYGSGGGFARRGTTNYNRQQGEHEGIIIRSGGIEANSVFSNTIRNRWLKDGKINYRESLLYLRSFHNSSLYISRTKKSNTTDPVNDIYNYIGRVNRSYGYQNPEFYKLTIDHLSKRKSVNLINTFHFFALYSYLKVYLFAGEEDFNYPMVKFGKIKWLPSIRFGLTPFGSEFVIENFLKTDKSITEITVRLGDNKLDSFYGGGLSYYYAFSNNLEIKPSFDFWVQPTLELGGISTFNTKEGFGGRIVGEINWQFKESIPVGIFGQFGYKTAGHIEGERLNKGVIFRLGISANDNLRK